MQPQTLQDKVYFVTGGASGIGYATAEGLLAGGASVAIVDLDKDRVNQAAQRLDTSGKRCIGIEVDVTKAQQIESALASTLTAFGDLHGAVNNAGIGIAPLPSADVDEADFDKVIGVNLKGVWLSMKHELAHLQKNGGAIVNIASVAGLVALAGQSAYTASKHAVVGLTKTAAVEYAPAGVRVNAICPGATRTAILSHFEDAGIDLTELEQASPMGRIATPDEIANAIVWLLSDQASFITGAAMPIDGGWTAP